MPITNLTWKASIYPTIQQLMTTDLVGLTNNTFTQVVGVKSLRDVPSSIFNGAFAIHWGGITGAGLEINNTLMPATEAVIEVAFALNPNDTDQSWINAVNDIETIIKTMLKLYMNSFEGLTFVKTTPFQYVGKDRSFAVCEIRFLFNVRINF